MQKKTMSEIPTNCSWFLSFLVSWFDGFGVSRFLGFKISTFQRFNDSILPSCHFMLFDRYWSHIQDFKILFNGPSGFYGARLFQNWQNCVIPTLRDLQNNIKLSMGFLVLFHPVVSKSRNKGFWELGTRPKIPNSKKWRFSGSPLSKTKVTS